MRGKRGRVAEADVAPGDIEDRPEALLPGSAAAKGPKPSLRNATASRSIFALVTLIVIAIYLVATENTSIEKRATVVVPAAEKRMLVDIGPNVTYGSLLPDGVPASAAPTPAAVVPAVVQPQAALAVVEDGPLPALSASMLEKHSNVVPGQVRKLVVAVIVDWQPQGTAFQVQQTKMTVSWVRTMKARQTQCVVGICENRMKVTRQHIRDILSEDWCGVFEGTVQECLDGPRLGRWWYVKQFMEMGFDVMSSDPDISFYRNPAPYFGKLIAQHPNSDVFTTTDANNNIVLKGSGPAGYVGIIESPEPPADGQQPQNEPTIWRKSFPHIATKEGFVYKSEFGGRDQQLEVGKLIDLLKSHKFELGLEDPINCEHQFNTGLMYWRATPAALRLIYLWQEHLRVTCCDWRTKDDQLPANLVFKNMSTHCPMWNGARGSGYNYAAQEKHKAVCGGDAMLNIVADGQGCLGILNVVQFANGFVFSTQRSHEQHFVRPYTFHATYSNDKLMSLRQEGTFHDGPDHYWIPSGVLVYDPVLRMDMFHADLGSADAAEGFYTPQAHVVFVQYQLQQLRIALAIAKALGRTLVLPRMACICQCFFFPGKNCNIDGHRVRLPHICPTDHWLRPGRLRLPHREPGFLDNPRLPAAMTEKKATVKVCAGGSCSPQVDAASGSLLLQANMTDRQWKAALKPVETFPVVHLTDVWNSWGGFEDKKLQEEFTGEISKILSSWCCLKTHPEGLRPEVEVWKIPYAWDGPMEPVPDTEDVGKCGA